MYVVLVLNNIYVKYINVMNRHVKYNVNKNQNVDFYVCKNSLFTLIKQNGSTPGIMLLSQLDDGFYKIEFTLEHNFTPDTKLFLFIGKSDVMNQQYRDYCKIGHNSFIFYINEGGKYNVGILATKPKQGFSYVVKDIVYTKTIMSDAVDPFFISKNVRQIFIPTTIKNVGPAILKKYMLNEYSCEYSACIFFDDDMSREKLKKHLGECLIIKSNMMSQTDLLITEKHITYDNIIDIQTVGDLKQIIEVKTLKNTSIVDTSLKKTQILIITSRNSRYNYVEIQNAILQEQSYYNFLYAYHETVDNVDLSMCAIILNVEDLPINSFVLKAGLAGIAIIHKNTSPNCVPFFSNSSLISEKIINTLRNYKNYESIITTSTQKYAEGAEPSGVCMFIPMYGRHNVVKNNITLLSNQTINVNIVVAYSNEEDMAFLIELQKTCPRLHMVFVENRPLSKKFQYALEFCKIFYPRLTICNGSDDYLSLGYAKFMLEKMDSGYNYAGCEYWYVADVVYEGLYRMEYIESNRLVGCGKCFYYTLLNDVEWDVFPLDINRSIDGASHAKVEKYAVPYHHKYAVETKNVFALSIKTDDEMITPMSRLLTSAGVKYEIVTATDKLLLILCCNTIVDTLNFFTSIENSTHFLPEIISHKKIGFVTSWDKQSLTFFNSLFGTIVNSLQIETLTADIAKAYDILLIDQYVIFSESNMVCNNLRLICDIPKILLVNSSKCFVKSIKLIKSNVKEKRVEHIINKLFKDNNICYAIYDKCSRDEDLMTQYCASSIKKSYLMLHNMSGIDVNINENILTKDIDLLIYGPITKGSLKEKLINIFLNNKKQLLKLKVAEPHDNISELLLRSWMAFTIDDDFSYVDVGAMLCIPVGSLGIQGVSLLHGNFIEINNNMADIEIIRTLTYYSNNVNIMAKMILRLKKIKMNYETSCKFQTAVSIFEGIVSNTETSQEYEKKKHSYVGKNITYSLGFSNVIISPWNANGSCTVNKLSNTTYSIIPTTATGTPGLKYAITLDEGVYMVVYGKASENYKCSVLCCGSDKKWLHNMSSLMINNIMYTLINLSKKDKYVFHILMSNPCVNKELILLNPSVIRFNNVKNNYIASTVHNVNIKLLENGNDLYVGGIGCPEEPKKIYEMLGCNLITKEIMTSNNNHRYSFIDENLNKKCLVLYGLYDPHKWETLYKPLLDKMNSVIICLCGTDIMQLVDNKNKHVQLMKYLKRKRVVFACQSEYIQNELFNKYNICSEILSIPLKGTVKQLPPLYDSNKIACYIGENVNYYNLDLVLQLAKKMHDYEFYIYRCVEFSLKEKQKMTYTPNIFFLSGEITNMANYMEDKLCGLRLTAHDGEPLICIDTLLMGRKFIFNFPMKYAELTTLNTAEIERKIRNVRQNNKPDENAVEYYTTKNSTQTYENSLNALFDMCTFDMRYILECRSRINTYAINSENFSISEIFDNYAPYIDFTFGGSTFEGSTNKNSSIMLENIEVLKNKTYSIIISGKTDIKLDITIVNNKEKTLIEHTYKSISLKQFPSYFKIIFDSGDNEYISIKMTLLDPEIGKSVRLTKIALVELG
jgi:hypothetical protein